MSLFEAIAEYVQSHKKISNSSELDYIVDRVLNDITDKVDLYYNEVKEVQKYAIKLSNYDKVADFLMNHISKDTLERVKSIDWDNILSNTHPVFKGNSLFGKFVWDNTCSGRNPFEIKMDMERAAVSNDPDNFIKSLNELLGNCCISNINELDDV